MRKIAPLLLFLALFSTTFSFAQKKKGYAEFIYPVAKKISIKNFTDTTYKVRFKSKVESTVYIELRRRGKLYGGANFTGKAKKEQVIELKLKNYYDRNLIAARDYELILFCYKGKNIFDDEIGEKTTISNVKVTRM